MSDASVLELREVTKRYRDVVALDGVSFGVKKGEIFGYIGPNGAGKTTTIKIMVGLLKDFSGEVMIDGRPIHADPLAMQRILGYLPQKAAFQEWRTVEQALSTFGRLSGMSAEEVDSRIPQVLELLGIPETLRRKIPNLSGGTVQKVGMAQAILHKPRLLVLDEPMTGLDPASRFQFKEIFKGLRDEGTTIFFSSHILADVQDIADRIGIIDRGKMLHLGTFSELQARMDVSKDVEVVLAREWTGKLSQGLLGRLRGIDRVGSDKLMVHLKPDADLDETIDMLIGELRASGNRIRSVRPVVPDLEELYVRLFRGERA